MRDINPSKKIQSMMNHIEKLKYMNSNEALKLAFEALELCKKNNFIHEEVILQVTIGGICCNISEYTKGIDFVVAAIPNLELYQLDLYLSIAFNTLGNIFYELAYYETAFDYYYKSLTIINKKEFNERLSIAHNNIAEIYKVLIDHERALAHYEISLYEDRKFNFKACKGTSHINIAEINYLQGNYEKALEVLDIGYDLAKKHHYENIFCEVYKLYALINWKLHNYEEANNYFSKAMAVAQEKMNYNYKIDILVFYHEFLVEYNYIEEAILALTDAYSLAEGNNLHEKSLNICRYFISIYEKIQRPELALRYYKLYLSHELERSKGRTNQIREGIDLRIKIEKIKMQSEMDCLTGIPNRRKLVEYLNTQLKHSISHRHHFSLIIIDIDFFKEFNDTYGHLEGDHCLISIAQLLSSSLEKEHFLARYGGDEFIAVLPKSNDQDALVYANKIRESVLNAKNPNRNSPISDYVTVTLGVLSLIPTEDLIIDDVIKKADKALYKGKKMGRNKVVLFTGI